MKQNFLKKIMHFLRGHPILRSVQQSDRGNPHTTFINLWLQKCAKVYWVGGILHFQSGGKGDEDSKKKN